MGQSRTGWIRSMRSWGRASRDQATVEPALMGSGYGRASCQRAVNVSINPGNAETQISLFVVSFHEVMDQVVEILSALNAHSVPCS